LLGRGSACINTAGEKVFPEEVEDVIRTHPSVNDVAVVGVADAKYGEMVTALVEARPGAIIDESAIVAHVKASLAGYKAPKHVLSVDSVTRGTQRQARLPRAQRSRDRTALGPLGAPSGPSGSYASRGSPNTRSPTMLR
jgi:acyl-CoA synthetase (AMP-forming)/AMP-acid ligase II